MKPKILFLCDRPGWAFDITISNIYKYIEAEFDVSIKYVVQKPFIDSNEYDLIYVFWWGERYHRLFLEFDSKISVIKEISSHRWEFEKQYGLHTSKEAYFRFMRDASALFCTSLRLKNQFHNVYSNLFYYPLGVNPEIFYPIHKQNKQLTFGWSGNIKDTKKGFQDILIPASKGLVEIATANGKIPYSKMPNFYQKLDVICIASIEEGTPLPLLEAMACGCFPICTDVGVVPEIIEDKVNGLIVERNPTAFRNAIQWCLENADLVQQAGLKNSEKICTERTWKISSDFFIKNIYIVLENIEKFKAQRIQEGSGMEFENLEKSKNQGIEVKSGTKYSIIDTLRSSYQDHFERINPSGYSDAAYLSSCLSLKEDLEPILPIKQDTKILEIGTGYGHLLRYLVEKGYTRVSGVDICKPLLEGIRERIGNSLEWLEVADARNYLERHPNSWDFIIMFDVIEHFTLDEAMQILQQAHSSLIQGGKIVLRTPNMANILGNYSHYQDITHLHAYSEWNLISLLEACGFQESKVHIPSDFSTKRRKLNYLINKAIHNFLFELNDKVKPHWYGKNIVITAKK